MGKRVEFVKVLLLKDALMWKAQYDGYERSPR